MRVLRKNHTLPWHVAQPFNRGKPRKKHSSLKRLDRIINFLPRVPLKILGGWRFSLVEKKQAAVSWLHGSMVGNESGFSGYLLQLNFLTWQAASPQITNPKAHTLISHIQFWTRLVYAKAPWHVYIIYIYTYRLYPSNSHQRLDQDSFSSKSMQL